MIIGAHTIILSKSPGADRQFFHDVLEIPNVDLESPSRSSSIVSQEARS